MTPNLRDKYTGVEFTELLRRGKPHDLWNPGRQKIITIYGPVRLAPWTPRELPPLTRLIFRDVFDMSDVTVPGSVDFSRCLFVQRLFLRNAEIHGDLRLDDAEVLQTAPIYGESPVGLDLFGARIHGAVRALRLNAGRIELNAAGASGRTASISAARELAG